jgi:hypothetical protein
MIIIFFFSKRRSAVVAGAEAASDSRWVVRSTKFASPSVLTRTPLNQHRTKAKRLWNARRVLKWITLFKDAFWRSIRRRRRKNLFFFHLLFFTCGLALLHQTIFSFSDTCPVGTSVGKKYVWAIQFSCVQESTKRTTVPVVPRQVPFRGSSVRTYLSFKPSVRRYVRTGSTLGSTFAMYCWNGLTMLTFGQDVWEGTHM